MAMPAGAEVAILDESTEKRHNQLELCIPLFAIRDCFCDDLMQQSHRPLSYRPHSPRSFPWRIEAHILRDF